MRTGTLIPRKKKHILNSSAAQIRWPWLRISKTNFNWNFNKLTYYYMFLISIQTDSIKIYSVIDVSSASHSGPIVSLHSFCSEWRSAALTWKYLMNWHTNTLYQPRKMKQKKTNEIHWCRCSVTVLYRGNTQIWWLLALINSFLS